MLKVEKKINKNKNKNQEDDITKAQSDLKNSIKNLYLDSQKKKKTIEDYAQLATEIRKEYAKLQQENNELKIQLHKYQSYVEQLNQTSHKKYYSKFMRKIEPYHDLQPESDETDESDSYVEVRRRPKKYRKKIAYEDELDGIPNYEPKSPSEDEQEENEVEIKKPIKKKCNN